jgi:hypothetical protein
VSKLLVALLLSLLAGAAFASEPQSLAATTTGALAVDAEGRVTSVILDHKELGEETMAVFERRIREWRFEPVLVEGRAVPVRAGIHLGLLLKKGARDQDDVFEISGVWLSETTTSDVDAVDVTPTEAEIVADLKAPLYPRRALQAQVGARVQLLLRIGADGKVVDVATHAAELRTQFAHSELDRKRFASMFIKGAERAAMKWRLPGLRPGVALMPVHFRMSDAGNDGRRWAPAHIVPIEPPAWATDEPVVYLNESGQPDSSRLRLLTALN